MPRRRDPQWFLERARQMEEEAKKLRDQGDRLRREREAHEDRWVGAALRRFWKKGWIGVTLDDVVEAANQVFGEPPAGQTGEGRRGDSDRGGDGAEGESEAWRQPRAHEVSGDLFGDRGEASHAGS